MVGVEGKVGVFASERVFGSTVFGVSSVKDADAHINPANPQFSTDGLPVSQYQDVNLGAHTSACNAKPVSTMQSVCSGLSRQQSGVNAQAIARHGTQDGSIARRKKGAVASAQSNRELALPICPHGCHAKVYRDGQRRLADGSEAQRWLCMGCGLRFSEHNIKAECAIDGDAKYAFGKGTKNLDSTTVNRTVAVDIKKTKPKTRIIDTFNETNRGYITQYAAYLERNGFNEETTYPSILTRLVKEGADLLDAESVKAVIAKTKKHNGESWSDSMKLVATCAYDAFCVMQKITWTRPEYHQCEAEIIVPDEKDLDALILAASRRMAAFLLCLKETFADPTEVLRCEWTELKDDILYINHPVKLHYPGKYQLTPQLLTMINALPRKSKYIFDTNYRCAVVCLQQLRRKAAKKYANPALLKISFKSYRHWGGSMLAQVTNGNVVEIARLLRHESWRSTQKYVHTINFKTEDFEVASVSTPEEILAIGKAGWQKYDEATFNGVTYHFYRRPKRFGGLLQDTTKTNKIGIYPLGSGDVSRDPSPSSFSLTRVCVLVFVMAKCYGLDSLRLYPVVVSRKLPFSFFMHNRLAEVLP